MQEDPRRQRTQTPSLCLLVLSARSEHPKRPSVNQALTLVSPDNTMFTCSSGNAKMLKRHGQGFHQFARLPYKVLLLIGKFAECEGDLSYVEIASTAVFVSQNNSSIVSFCCFSKLFLQLTPLCASFIIKL